eukprot:SAG31_NODE_1091_length_9958_cov_10.108429_3_plen_379_part_00
MAALLLLVAPLAGTGGADCTFEAPHRGCSVLRWDLAGLSAAIPTPAQLKLNDSWPEAYRLAAPCHTVDLTGCPACAGKPACAGVQLQNWRTNKVRGGPGGPDPHAPCSAGSRCFSIGGATPLASAIDPFNPDAGLHLTYSGGDSGRELHHWVHCGKAGTTAPSTLVAFDSSLPGYNVNWTSPLGCPTIVKSNCSTAKLPKPTPEQLAWQQGEIMALIHFNMATYFGESGCTSANWNGSSGSSNPANFKPIQLDTDNWAQSMRALGVKESVLTAKHGCGFCTWPTTATLPDGSPYGYNVPKEMDVLSQYVASMEKAGIGHGFYYSLDSNFYLTASRHGMTGPHVTDAEFQAIEIHQMTELWTQFGNVSATPLFHALNPT